MTATHATIVVTVKLNENDPTNLGERVARELRNAGAEIVQCGWEPDPDTIAECSGFEFEDLAVVDLSPPWTP